MSPVVIDEPAAAVAAALCLAARDRSRQVTTRHPRACSWCDYPADALRSMVEGFNAWAGFNEDKGTYARHDARVFAELPRARQAELVHAAQGFEEETGVGEGHGEASTATPGPGVPHTYNGPEPAHEPEEDYPW